MDWNLAIEKNREALKRILAMLVAMAGLAAFTSPLRGGRRSADRRVGVIAASQPPPDASRRPPRKGEVKPAFTLPRHLHRAILRLLRPAESAARRLVIVTARGLVVTLPPAAPAQGEAAPDDPAQARRHRHPDAPWRPSCPGARPARSPCRCSIRSGPFARRRPVANGIPRISLPGVTAPSPIALRRPPAPDDPLDATRLALRLQALGAALDDLPRQARRFARWKAARGVDAAGAQNKEPRRRRRAKQRTARGPLAASGRCVPAARPASAPPTGAPTRCTRS